MNMSVLYTLVYTSIAPFDYDKHDLLALLHQARRKNEQLNITGMLLYTNKRFIQVLEGEKETVLSLHKKIHNDPRHFNVTTIMENKIDKRMFPDWTMGYKNIDPIEYQNIPGLTLFLDNDDVAKPYELLLSYKDDHTCFDNEIT